MGMDCEDSGCEKCLKAAGLRRRADLLAKEITALFRDAREASIVVTLEQTPRSYGSDYGYRSPDPEQAISSANTHAPALPGTQGAMRTVYVLPITIRI